MEMICKRPYRGPLAENDAATMSRAGVGPNGVSPCHMKEVVFGASSRLLIEVWRAVCDLTGKVRTDFDRPQGPGPRPPPERDGRTRLKL